MDSRDTVTVVDGVIEIDDPEIEAGLATLAQRWSISAEQALSRALTIGMAPADHVLEDKYRKSKNPFVPSSD